MSNFSIQAIYQKDNEHFIIEWADGLIHQYNLYELQQVCPCAGCADKSSKNLSLNLSKSVKASQIQSVGRYALRIAFTSGCSYGIYQFDFLRKMKEPKTCNE